MSMFRQQSVKQKQYSAVEPEETHAMSTRAQTRKGLKDVTNSHSQAQQAMGKAVKRSSQARPRQSGSRHVAAPVDSVSKKMASATFMEPNAMDIIDIETRSDPREVSEYVSDIIGNLRKKEQMTSINSDYMAEQPHINEKMRAILIDWLVEVHLKFKLVPDTIWLTVNLIDRFLAVKTVARPKLQLVGVTALLLASKYEDIYPPELRDLVYITDRAYTKSEILKMEAAMLDTLKFNLTVPTTNPFLCRFVKAAKADSQTRNLATFIAERSMQEYGMLKFSPSMVAASSVYVAHRTIGLTWTNDLERCSNYSEDMLQTCANAMMDMIHTRTSLQAVVKKYSSSNYGSVANIPIPQADR